MAVREEPRDTIDRQVVSENESSPSDLIIDMNSVLGPVKLKEPTANTSRLSIHDNENLECILPSTPAIEDIVNPSLDPAEVLGPGQNGGSPADSEIGGAVMAPFSPILPHHGLSNSGNSGCEHIFRRGTPVGLYSNNGADISNENTGALNATTTLLPYNLRTSRLIASKPSQLMTRSTNHGSSTPTTSNNVISSKKKLATTKAKPAFINKLWSMVNDPVNQTLIHWGEDGKSFIVTQREQFVHNILPKYFKHSNFASFVRQLNMYGWHKVQDVKSGSIQSNIDDRWEFANENFIRGREDLLANILRQKSGSIGKDGNPAVSASNSKLDTGILVSNGEEIDIAILITELETVKYNQMAIAEDLRRISKDNEMLWKENIMARDRHQSQQQALEKIVKFLSSLYGSNTTRLLSEHLFHENRQTSNAMTSTHNSTMAMSPIQAGDFLENQQYNNKDSVAKVPMAHSLRPRLLIKERPSPPSSSYDTNATAEWIKDQPVYDDIISTSDVKSISSSLQSPRTNLSITHPPEVNNTSAMPPDIDHTSFFNDLHENIERQGDSIQEIQDWINKLTPNDLLLNTVGEDQHHFSRFDPQEYLSAPTPQLIFTAGTVDDVVSVRSSSKRPLEDVDLDLIENTPSSAARSITNDTLPKNKKNRDTGNQH